MWTGLDRVSLSLSSGVAVAILAAFLACQPSATGAAGAQQDGAKPARSGAKARPGELPGVDTSQLTSRERAEWWTHVSELLAPCQDQPVSIAQCVREARPCASCTSAAKFLLRQVTLGKTRAQIEGAFTLRFDPDSVKRIDSQGAPFKGPQNAQVTVVEWADFQCPFCALASPYLDYIVRAYPSRVKVVFRHFPISYHSYGVAAAQAAIAADRQGKFWQMHDLLFANREHLDDATFLRLAQKLGLDTDRFQVDMAAQSTLDAIERDRRAADELGLRGTPMLYVNGRNFDLQHFDLMQDLQPWIETEIEILTGDHVRPALAPPNLTQLHGETSAAGDAR